MTITKQREKAIEALKNRWHYVSRPKSLPGSWAFIWEMMGL